MTNKQSGVWLPTAFTPQHQQVVMKHLEKGRWTLSSTEWRWALEGFGLLHNALVYMPSEWLSFRSVYDLQVDAPFAERYLADLLALDDVKTKSKKISARYAQLITANWYRSVWPQLLGDSGRLLLSYWLYWWRSFTYGYAFEVQVFRDLETSNIAFTAHNILDREERRSHYDLEVLGLFGDIKTSFYFLRSGRSSNLPHDFYITRLWYQNRSRIMVVLMQPVAWEQINGDAERTTWEVVRAKLPKIASLLHKGREVVLVTYEEWKTRIQNEQFNE